ncbi:MAG: 50S ribosomal protein L23 [Nitrospinota bacterium]|jgi:large subunit ribosomal protein L23|nr:50S ribosomal protein L23 [Nitrospinota bacterium]
MEATEVIRRPLVTEKSVQTGEEQNKVAFEVDLRASKTEIRRAVESLFSVGVVNVNTMRVPGKRIRVGRHAGIRSPWKKAIVTLKEGDRIEFLEGA